MHVTGGRCEIEDCQAGPGLATGFDIDGARTQLRGCHTVAYTVDGYYIGNDCCSLRDCSAIGTGTATRGFYVTGSADRVRLWHCASVANATAGYEIDTGCVNTLVKDCASGGGDGAKVDDGTNTVWSHYTFDSLLHKESTLAGAGDYDLFQVTGVVQINYIYGIVETQIAADTTGAYLNLFPTGGVAIEITDITGAGRDISGAVVGSMVSKTALATVSLDLDSASLGFVAEVATNYRNALKPFVLGQKTGGIDTFVRLTVAGTGNRSELVVGYFTKYGDGGCDILPIGGLLKGRVRELAGALGIPRKIIDKVPSAGLWAGQTDEGELGLSYQNLDEILGTLDDGRAPEAGADLVARVRGLMAASGHKRALPPICELRQD